MIDLFSANPSQLFTGFLVVSSAATYGIGFLNSEINAHRSFWKTLPVLLLTGAAILFGGPLLLSVALLLCALGDYFLSRGSNRFVPGLLAFMAGHIVYIALFISTSDESGLRWQMPVVFLYSIVFATYMWNTAGNYRWPVIAYIAVITVMASVSLTLPPAHFLAVMGVFVFLFSDSVLAVRMFVVRNPSIKLALSWAVWVSYILGQSLIVIGVLGAA